MSRVLEFNDLRSAAVLAGDWRRLLALTPRATFFQTFEWLRAYWRHFGEGQQLRLLAVESAGTLLGIVPLVIRTEQHRFGPVRVLTYPLEDWGFWFGPIGPPSQAVATLALQHLAATPRDWDLCELRWNNEEEADRDGMAAAMTTVGLAPERTITDRTSILALDEFTGWEDYLMSRTSKVRKTFAGNCDDWSAIIGWSSCGIGRRQSPRVMANRGGTCTTNANDWPKRVGKRT